VQSVAFSPDGRRIVSGSADRTLRLWEATTGQPVGKPLQGHRSALKAVAFSPDGRHIFSVSVDNTVLIWTTAKGRLVTTAIQGRDDSLRAVAFSPDRHRIVTAFTDRTLWLWDVAPASYLRLACQRLHRHQLLLHPERFAVGKDFEAIARRARDVCANPPPPLPALNGLHPGG
jgi:WD40 repeat protein